MKGDKILVNWNIVAPPNWVWVCRESIPNVNPGHRRQVYAMTEKRHVRQARLGTYVE
jgi:hypothetical protein